MVIFNIAIIQVLYNMFSCCFYYKCHFIICLKSNTYVMNYEVIFCSATIYINKVIYTNH